MAIHIFERVEEKYLINEEIYLQFIKKIAPFVKEDAYLKYLVINIYFDTPDSELIQKSIDRPVFKEKLRLRSYDVPKITDIVFLEIKRKFEDKVSKRRICLTLQEALDYIEKGIKPQGKGQIMDEIDYFIKFYSIKPKIYISYEREAYIGINEQDLRITFDRNITSQTESLELQTNVIGNKLIEDHECVLEIKTINAFPIWLVKILAELKIYPTSFSKYGKIYKKSHFTKEYINV